LHELNHIKPEQLRTENGKHFVDVEKGKGGKNRTVEVKDAKAFQAYKSLVDSKHLTTGKYAGKFVFSSSAYRSAVSRAAAQAGERERGTHSFRWNYAQEQYIERQIADNKPESQAKIEVSHELGHNRASITDHYLHR